MPTDATGREIVGYDAAGNPIYADGKTVTPGKTTTVTLPSAPSQAVQVDPNPTTPDREENWATGVVPTVLTGGVNKAGSDPWGIAESAATGGTIDVLNKTDAGGYVSDGANALTGGASDVYGGLGVPGFGDSDGGSDKDKQTQLAIDATAQSTANSQSIMGQALASAARAGGYQGPNAVTAGTIASPERLERAAYWNTAPTTAESVDATNRMLRAQTVDVKNVPMASVGSVDTNINAPTIGDAAQTGRVQVGATQADPLADAIRAEQVRAAQDISSSPSAVTPTMQAGQLEALQNALSVAAQARGSERAGARRDAIIAMEQGGLAASLKAAALGSEESQAKRTASAQALSNVRAQDITSAGNRQALDAQRNSLQAQLDSAIAQGNTAAINTIKAQQAQLELDAQKAEVSAGLTQQGTQAGLSTANLGVMAQQAQANAAASNKAEADAIAARNTAAEAAAGRQTQVNVTSTALGNAQAEANMGRALDAAKTNITTTQQASGQNVANTLEAAKTTAANELEAQKLRTSGETAGLNTANVATGTQSTNAGTIVGANKSGEASAAADKAADRALAGTIITAAAASSDERLKQDVSPVGTGGSAVLDDFEERTRGLSHEQQTDTLSAMESLATSTSRPATPHNREWAGFLGQHQRDDFGDLEAAYALKKAAGREMGEQTSDERTKRQVDSLDSGDIQDWAEDASKLPVSFRYKQGIEDGGADPHLGVLAQDLESTGPVGKIMVHKDGEGARSVEYGALGLMLGKAAFDRSTEALELARSLAGAATGDPPRRRGESADLGPALALAASRSERGRAVR